MQDTNRNVKLLRYLCCFKLLTTCNLLQVTIESVPDFLEHLFNGSITELKAKFEKRAAKELD